MNVIKEAEYENRDTFIVKSTLEKKGPKTTKNQMNETLGDNNQMKFANDDSKVE